jgi:hypothetical protein
MKKNLRNILALSLGLMTTVAFAQDWNVDSRTRIDMGGDNDKMETAQRATVGLTWGGDSWGIHASTVVNYNFDGNATLSVYEAYASTDLMGYASVTAGRQALNYGSGLLIGSNEWGAIRYTRDAFIFGLDLDMADVTLGLQSRMDGAVDGAGVDSSNGQSGYWLNASKAEGDWSANLLYGTQTATAADVDGDATTYMGLDLSYAMMGGDLSLNVSYNTVGGLKDLAGNAADMDMMSIGATYNVNESMSIHASQTSYGENGFNLMGGNAGVYGAEVSSWTSHGNMGHLGNDQKDLAIGGTYAMGDFNLSATMHTVTDDTEDVAGSTTNADYERAAMELSLGYTMSANAGLSVNYATDNNGGDTDTKYTWLTLTVRP